jgi:hypothetical protein
VPVFLDRLHRHIPDWDHALLASLSEYPNAFRVRIDVPHIERGEFRQTQPAAVESSNIAASRCGIHTGALSLFSIVSGAESSASICFGFKTTGSFLSSLGVAPV